MYVIEYQKRGLPHAHILLWLHEESKIKEAEDIDKIISAELPNPEEDSIGYSSVAEFMVHGPCGNANMNSPCMNKETKLCSKYFPKSFANKTSLDENGYPVYMRRDNQNIYVQKGDIKLDNRYVVPYNLDLVVKYQAHINVEVCNKSKSMKYLFKYLTKGEDRTIALLTLHGNNKGSTNEKNDEEVDEIKAYLDCRYLSPIESCWRIFDFDIHYRYPAIERLSFHLPDEEPVFYNDKEKVKDVLKRRNIKKTMFNEWMVSNKKNPEGRNLTYSEYPTKFVWKSTEKKWNVRIKGNCIGRLYAAHPSQGEKYYLRILLNIVQGPCSYEEIRTFDGITYATFKDACYARGLLDNEKEWIDCMIEASYWASPNKLRHLFVTIILFCEVTIPSKIYNACWEQMSEDILYKQRKILNCTSFTMTEEHIKNNLLFEIETLLQKCGTSLHNFPDMPFPKISCEELTTNKLILEETNYNIEKLIKEHDELHKNLNGEQKDAYNAIIESVQNGKGKFIFVQGHGGTGKTFLWKTICARLRSEGKIVLTVASSGTTYALLHENIFIYY